MDSLRGNLSAVNEIPFAAMESSFHTNVWGTGFTPEGIDQNPALYEMVIEQNWRHERVPNVTKHLIERAHRRYGLASSTDGSTDDANVTKAWGLIAKSAYTFDLWGMDSGGVTHLPAAGDSYAWENADTAKTHGPCVKQSCNANFSKPIVATRFMCMIWSAFSALVDAAPRVMARAGEPYIYDLINTGREVMNQLMIPVSIAFNESIDPRHFGVKMDPNSVKRTGDAYVALLNDMDELLNTDTAFQVGGWIKQARDLAAKQGGTDCIAKGFEKEILTCAHMYEWNARVQITSWDPTPKGSAKPGKDTVDYASKHWSGLVKDYYGARVTAVQMAALEAAAAGTPLTLKVVDRAKAKLSYEWTTSQRKYPSEAVGDPLAVSKNMRAKYKSHFATCPSGDEVLHAASW